jgi:thymidine phosphorylase
LRDKSILLAGTLLELVGAAQSSQGAALAARALDDGRAWRKFQRICDAQGGMREPPRSQHRRPILAEKAGRVHTIDNRRMARLAKLAGAPDDKAAGVDLHVAVGDEVTVGQPLCTVHADASGQLAYAFDYAAINRGIVGVREA